MTSTSTHDEDIYLRGAEVARLFKVSDKTVIRWANNGKLPYRLTLGGHRRYPASAVHRMLQAAAFKLESEDGGPR